MQAVIWGYSLGLGFVLFVLLAARSSSGGGR
jgi:hypothetical protein